MTRPLPAKIMTAVGSGTPGAIYRFKGADNSKIHLNTEVYTDTTRWQLLADLDFHAARQRDRLLTNS